MFLFKNFTAEEITVLEKAAETLLTLDTSSYEELLSFFESILKNIAFEQNKKAALEYQARQAKTIQMITAQNARKAA